MKPNIVFYFSDQQRWDTLGCYGQRLPVTPHLDELASQGVRFENVFTCQPVCGPARACLQSGKYATEIGCFTNERALPLNTKTIAHYFREAGYDTAYIGKWHLASDRDGESYEKRAVPEERRGGYQYWMASDVLEFTSHGYDGYVFDGQNQKVEFTGYRADCINNYAIDYVKQHDKTKPFFLFLSQIEPHHQNDHKRFEGPKGSQEKFKDFEVPGDLIGTEGDWRENYPDYLGCCNSLDENVGRLVDTLKEEGIWENTILIYTSDHGCHFRTRNGEYKRSCHDGSIRVPLIACGGVFSGGKVVDELVSLMDIPPTLLACAGIETPEDFRGRSLLPYVNGDVQNSDAEIFLQISEQQVARAIRTKEWKYSVAALKDPWEDMGSDVYYEDCLYNLREDPYEKNNLAADPKYEEVRKKLAEQLSARMERAKEKKPVILPASQRPDRKE